MIVLVIASPMVPVMSSDPLIPRGNALTEAMEFTARDGRPWVAYIEGVPAATRPRLLRQTVLPGRRVRFDSAAESRVSTDVPAGAPFLAEHRLERLLAGSQPLAFSQPPAAESGRELWQRRRSAAAAHARRLRARARAFASQTGHALHLAVEGIHFGRRLPW